MTGRTRSDDPERLGAILRSMGADRPWASGLLLGDLGRRWPEVVGVRLAVETSPAALESGLLLVRASSAAWAAQVRFLVLEIRDRANAVLGADSIREVRVTVDGGPIDR